MPTGRRTIRTDVGAAPNAVRSAFTFSRANMK
jgi:hypothetical protein